MSTAVRLATGTAVVALGALLACGEESTAPSTIAGLAVAVVSPAAIVVDTYVVMVKGPQTATLKGVPGGSLTFPGLKAGQYAVLVEGYRSGSLASFGMSSATVTRGATASASVTVTALKLVFTQQPTNAITGQAITPTIEVTAQDSLGNADANFDDSVTVAIATNPGGATLGGTPKVLASAGRASFPGLSISKTGNGYRLAATSTTVETGAMSGTFSVSVGSAATLAVNAGDGQSAAVNATVATPPSVIVRDAFGNPVAGTSVTFAVASGGGSTTGTNPVTTGSNGVAAIGSWRLGLTAGANTLTATATGLAGSPVTFTATATALPVSAVQSTIAAAPASIVASSGGTKSTITVTAKDANGTPISGAAVVLAATGAGNTLTQPSGATNASGVATGTLSSTAAGQKVVSATISGVAITQTATVTVTNGAASTIAVNAGNGQTANVNATVATPPSVIVTDAFGNPVSGTSVTFAVASGGGSVTGTNPVATGSNGIAAIGSWKLGPTPGANTLTATAAGLTPVTFTATATALPVSASRSTVAAAPATIAASSGGTKSTITVTAKDANGDPISGVIVVLAATGAGNTLTQPSGPTNASGVATGTLSSTATGQKVMTATISAVVITQTATVTVTSAAASTIAVNAGNGQTAKVDKPVDTPPSVIVTDAFGNPVSGRSVTFAVASGGGSISGANPVMTGSDGVAAIGSWKLGTTVGVNTLTATATGLSGSPVIFTATATP